MVATRYLLVFLVPTLAALAAAAVAAHGASSWSVAASPSPNDDRNFLFGVSADAPHDAWAVGEQYPGSGALIEHWNGSSWALSSNPAFAVDPVLNAVAAIAPDNVWAVGDYYNAAGQRQSVIEHWDGDSWSVVPSPNLGADDALFAAAAVSADDVWAVGHSASSTASAPALIEHWDGSSWQVVPSPPVAYPSNLRGVVALSADDVWAVGSAGSDTLTEHWNGSTWSVVRSPSPSVKTRYLSASNVLDAVTATASNDVWAVGIYDTTGRSDAAYHTLVEHWNGSKWSLVDSPDGAAGYGSFNRLDGVAAVTATDIWAVGHSTAGASGATNQILIEHWDGSSWMLEPSPIDTVWNTLDAVAARGSGALWGVGAEAQQASYKNIPFHPQTLVLGRGN